MTSESPGRGRSLVTVLSARRKCCEDTHHSEQARQSEREREKPVLRSHSSLTHPVPSSRVQCVTGVTRHLIGPDLSTLVPHWPEEKGMSLCSMTLTVFKVLEIQKRTKIALHVATFLHMTYILFYSYLFKPKKWINLLDSY